MKKKNWISFCLLTIVLASVFVLLLAGSPSSGKKEARCDNESMATCNRAKKAAAPGESIMEGLSRQFLVITPVIY